MPQSSTKFRLKKGFCHITDDAVMITRYEHLEDFSQKSRLSLLLYGLSTEILVAGFIAYMAFDRFQTGNWPYVGLMALLFLLNGYRIVMHFLYSSDNLIKRDEISLVEFKKGIPYFIVPQFVIYYESGGKQRKRLLPLAGSLYGKSARTTVMEAMKNSGLYKPGALNEDLLDSV